MITEDILNFINTYFLNLIIKEINLTMDVYKAGHLRLVFQNKTKIYMT
jgi:hypothetical protein